MDRDRSGVMEPGEIYTYKDGMGGELEIRDWGIKEDVDA
jgi:hypothetical protein